MASYSVNDARRRARPASSSTPASTCSTATGATSSPAPTTRTRSCESHSWDEYAEWHLGPHRGRQRRDQGPLRLRLRRLPPPPPHGPDRLPVPGRRVAPQGGRARRPRAAAAARREERLGRENLWLLTAAPSNVNGGWVGVGSECRGRGQCLLRTLSGGVEVSPSPASTKCAPRPAGSDRERRLTHSLLSPVARAALRRAPGSPRPGPGRGRAAGGRRGRRRRRSAPAPPRRSPRPSRAGSPRRSGGPSRRRRRRPR